MFFLLFCFILFYVSVLQCFLSCCVATIVSVFGCSVICYQNLLLVEPAPAVTKRWALALVHKVFQLMLSVFYGSVLYLSVSVFTCLACCLYVEINAVANIYCDYTGD